MKRLVAIAGVLAIAALVWHHMAVLGDGFWSIATGRYLFAHGLPHDDPFSYASTNDWTVVSAGNCAVFAAIANLIGLRGVMIVLTAVETLAVALVWLGSAEKALARAALLPLALFFVQVDAEDLSARGQIFGDLGLVLLLWILARLRDGKRVHPALVAALAIAWTNLHFSFLSAIALPALAGVIALTIPTTRARPFFVVAAIAILSACVTPYGPRYLPFVVGSAFDPSMATFDLFRSPDFHSLPWLVAPVLAVVLVTRLANGDPRNRLPIAFLLLFVAAACRSRRFATGLVIVEIAVAGPLLDAALPAARRGIIEAVAALAAIFGVVTFAREGLKDPLRDVPSDGAPVARTLADPTFGGVVAPLHWGGYLAYAWMGTPRYMIDGRDHIRLFGNGTFDDATALWSGAENSLALLDVYDARVVLWERGAPLDRMLREDPHWRLAFESAMDVVFTRR